VEGIWVTSDEAPLRLLLLAITLLLSTFLRWLQLRGFLQHGRGRIYVVVVFLVLLHGSLRRHGDCWVSLFTSARIMLGAFLKWMRFGKKSHHAPVNKTAQLGTDFRPNFFPIQKVDERLFRVQNLIKVLHVKECMQEKCEHWGQNYFQTASSKTQTKCIFVL
jgi:hypothetical protein